MAEKKRVHDKSNVVVEDHHGRLRLRLAKGVADTRHLTLGMPTNPLNQEIAKHIADQIHLDIVTGKLDRTLAKYDRRILKAVPTAKPTYTLLQIFDKFITASSPDWEQNTIAKYGTYNRYLERCPYTSIEDARAVLEWTKENLPDDSGKRFIVRLNAACKWATKQGLIESSPFEGLAEEMKGGKVKNEDVDPFTAEERDEIIRAYEEHAYYCRFAPIIKFLFWTGCRTSEAIGLRWCNVDLDRGVIKFAEATVKVNGRKYNKGTKTGKIRRFPVNERLLLLLMRECPIPPNPDQFVFLANSKQVDYSTLDRSWRGGSGARGIVTDLVKEGKVTSYRNLYQTRHTWCSLAIIAGNMTIGQIALLVGNSISMCEKVYVRPADNIRVPEF